MEEKFLLLLAFYLLLRKLSPWRPITRHHYRVIITTTYATVTFLSWSVIYEFSMLRISCKSVTNTLACYWWPFSTKPFCNPLQYMAHSCNMQYIGKGVTWNHIESHLLYTFWFLQSWNMDIVIPRTHIDHTLFPTLSNLTLWYCINIGLNIRIPETALNCDASPHTKLDSKAYILVYNRKPFTSFFPCYMSLPLLANINYISTCTTLREFLHCPTATCLSKQSAAIIDLISSTSHLSPDK